jgi:energy-coupling factor transporter ATP-binding protein EcfA2
VALGRVNRVVLRAGAQPESGPRPVDLGPVTVLVGPNNGGKSTALKDLMEYVNRSGSTPMSPWTGGTVIDGIELEEPGTLEDVLEFLAPRTHNLADGQIVIRTFRPGIGDSGSGGIQAIPQNQLDPSIESPEHVAVRLLAPYTIWLNGRQRFELANESQSGPLDAPPTSHWMAVEREDDVYEEVDAMVFAAFEQHLVIRTFRPPQLQPALSPVPLSDEVRHSTSQEAVAQQQAAVPLNELSDGVQVFCGLIAAVATLPHLLLLIDEPEAFLHPTLCRRLGANLARIARQRNARLITATHSAEFLLGCLEEVPETTVLRLDYRAGVPASHVLAANRVSELSRDPLLRSADALHALFSRSSVVCEADSDRAFYEEINRRLIDADGRVGALDSTFLNAQNWQTTVRIAAPLRAAGAPAAIVLDLDTLAQNDAWSEIVGMADLPQPDRERILMARAAARDAIVACGRAAPTAPLKVKTSGLNALDPTQHATVQTAIGELASIGVFLVDVGELENWLSQFGCTNKQTWVTDVLQRLGTPEDPAYVTPGIGDVWSFVERIANWLEDPARKGMPST